MNCETDGKPSQDQDQRHDREIIMYYSDMPVIKVQHGTTLGLTKMLYESIRGDGRIIGVKPRQCSPSLVCIITQDNTSLTEKEYDIILNAGSKVTEHTTEADSLSRHDKSVNTLITVDPRFTCEGQTSFMCAMSKTSQSSSCEDNINTDVLPPKCNFPSVDESTVHHNCKVNIRTACVSKNSYVVDWKCDQPVDKLFVHDQKWIRTNGLVTSDRNDGECLVHNTPSNQDGSTSTTCTVVSDTDSRSSPEDSTKYPPSQVYQPTLYQRKSGEEESDAGNSNRSEDEVLIQGNSGTRRENKKWQCLHCFKSFLCRSALENHQRTHTGEKPFQCTHCGRCFSHQGNLKQHLYIHRDVKPHICDICGKGFTRSNRLRDHKLLHDLDIPDKNCKIFVAKKFEWTPLTTHNSLSSTHRTSRGSTNCVLDSSNAECNDFQQSSQSSE